jgi:hypothetical protein
MLLQRANLYRLDPTPEQAGAGRFYVYRYLDPRPGKVGQTIYIGKGTISQRRAHKHWNHKADNIILDRIFKECRALNLVAHCEVVAVFEEESEAFALERELISHFGRRDMGLGSLCNLTDGGEGASGHIHSPASRARMSAAHIGKKRPADVVKKCAAFHQGKARSVETKAKLAQISTGKTHTAEAKARISAAHTGRKHTLQHRINIATAQAAKRGVANPAPCNDGIECPHCGVVFPRRIHGGGRPQKFCSDRCRMGHKRGSPVCFPAPKQLREALNVAA